MHSTPLVRRLAVNQAQDPEKIVAKIGGGALTVPPGEILEHWDEIQRVKAYGAASLINLIGR